MNYGIAGALASSEFSSMSISNHTLLSRDDYSFCLPGYLGVIQGTIFNTLQSTTMEKNIKKECIYLFN